MGELSPEVDRALRAAGWTPGRRQDVADWELLYRNTGLEFHPAARAFLAEFGGVLVKSEGSGPDRRMRFSLDPDDACGDEALFRDWSADLSRQLYPIGGVATHRYLGMDERGVIYTLDELEVCTFGPAPEALNALFLNAPGRLVAQVVE